MKVVHITPYFPPCKGGIARFVSGLVQRTRTTEEVHVISQEGEPSREVSVLSVGKGRFVIKTLKLLRKMDPDVIHCHSHWHMLAPAVLHKRFHRRVRVLFTFHTEPPEQKKGMKSNVFGRLLSKCDAVTFVSRALQHTIASQIQIKSKQVVIYPGVEGKAVSEQDLEDFAEKYGTRERSPILVFVGLLEWERKVQGVKVLLAAIATIREKHPQLRMLIVGDGSRRREVENTIADLNLSDVVTLTGLVGNVFVPLTICDIYVHISLQEGMPQSLLEAMFLGKPVVASNVGGIPEVVKDGETGLLVEPEKDAVAIALSDLIEDTEKSSKLGKQARDFLQSKFSWEEIAGEFLELYAGQ